MITTTIIIIIKTTTIIIKMVYTYYSPDTFPVNINSCTSHTILCGWSFSKFSTHRKRILSTVVTWPFWVPAGISNSNSGMLNNVSSDFTTILLRAWKGTHTHTHTHTHTYIYIYIYIYIILTALVNTQYGGIFQEHAYVFSWAEVEWKIQVWEWNVTPILYDKCDKLFIARARVGLFNTVFNMGEYWMLMWCRNTQGKNPMYNKYILLIVWRVNCPFKNVWGKLLFNWNRTVTKWNSTGECTYIQFEKF